MEKQDTPRQIVLCKSGYKNWRTQEKFKTVEELQDYSMKTQNLEEIAYHFIIEESGVLHQGRELDEKSQAVRGHDNRIISICLMGDFCKAPPTIEQLDTLKMLVLAMCKKFKIKTDMHHLFCVSDYRDPPVDRYNPGTYLSREVRHISKWVMDKLKEESKNVTKEVTQ